MKSLEMEESHTEQHEDQRYRVSECHSTDLLFFGKGEDNNVKAKENGSIPVCKWALIPYTRPHYLTSQLETVQKTTVKDNAVDFSNKRKYDGVENNNHEP